MPKLTAHQSQSTVKLLLEGDSGTGKTSSLISLVEAGYKLAILDYDNGLDPLVNLIRAHKDATKLMESVYFETLTDRMVARGGVMVPAGVPKAFSRGMELLTNWKTETDDLGPVSSWGPDMVLVIDSFTFMSKAAMRWVESLNVSKDGRAIYGEAQKRVEGCLAMLYSPEVKCHVVAISHIVYLEQENAAVMKGFPSTIGRALSPVVPRYFNTVLQTETRPGGARVIKLKPTGLIDLKTSVPPDKLPADFPLATGLRQFFSLATGEQK
jgi:hypothetical protein